MQMPKKQQIKQIGDALVEKNLVSRQDIDAALQLQDQCGEKIGRILLSEGKINSYNFHRELADTLGMRFVDLEDEPCDPVLLEDDERQNYLSLYVVPWKKEGKNIILATSEISPKLKIWADAKYKHYSFIITSSFDVYRTVQKNFAKQDDEDARELLWRESPWKSAKTLFMTPKGRKISLFSFMGLFAFMFVQPIVIGLFFVTNVFYFITLLFKTCFFVLGSFSGKKDKGKNNHRMSDRELPIYTILVPLYKEKSKTITQLAESIKDLDYPKAKLDIKLITEEDDKATIESIKLLKLSNIFEIVKVPFSLPRTKAKACNYALKFSKGEYVTIYDAEDKPDPAQLRDVIATFNDAESDLACVQAKLGFYNKNENLLTRMSAIEYSSWFNFTILGLQYLKMPVPLAGTSNHFKIDVLREVYAWDPYNVSEDADMGLRLAKKGLRMTIIDSTTLEESPVSYSGWIGQRTRWFKGHMQTFAVHIRKPGEMYKDLGFKGFMGFVFSVAAPSVVFLTLPFTLLFMALAYFDGTSFPSWFVEVAVFNFSCAVISHIIIAITVSCHGKWWDMVAYSLAFPFYWVLHVIASFRALWQLITKPHFWHKTEHGLTKLS